VRFQVVPAAYVFLRRTEDGVEQTLLQLRQGTGYMDGHWAAAAAGHVEAGESVLDAAVREAAEELGITIDPADLVPLCAMHRTAAPHGPIDERVARLPGSVVPYERQVMTALRDGSLQPIVTHGFPG